MLFGYGYQSPSAFLCTVTMVTSLTQCLPASMHPLRNEHFPNILPEHFAKISIHILSLRQSLLLLGSRDLDSDPCYRRRVLC